MHPATPALASCKPPSRGRHAARLLLTLALTAALSPLAQAKSFSTLARLDRHGSNGYPSTALTVGPEGLFYAGTIQSVFAVDTQGTITTRHVFDLMTEGDFINDLHLQPDGYFYGTAGLGGSAAFCGTLFQMAPEGTLTVLHAFQREESCNLTDIAVSADGYFYGAGSEGGSANKGSVFRADASGQVTVLHQFLGGADGEKPRGITALPSGDLLIITERGGNHDLGAVYRMTPAGSMTLLHSFGALGPAGNSPISPLTVGSDGNYYGSTNRGDINFNGTLFSMAPSGLLQVLHTFTGRDGQATMKLVEAPNQSGSTLRFYGASAYGGTYSKGQLFTITSGGSYTVLHEFQPDKSGEYPNSPLPLDGWLYGTTFDTGKKPYAGTVFKLRLP
jgi:uncharacterized repeat protein (TIGR03803 family)